MKKVMKIILAAVIIFMNICLSAERVQAAGGTIRMTSSDSEVEVGSIFTVTIEIAYEGGSAAEMALSYSSEYLELVEYPQEDFNKLNGRLLVDAAQSDKTTINFVFKTLKTGYTTVSLAVIKFVSMSGSDIYGYGNSLTTSVNIVEKKETRPEDMSADSTIKEMILTNGNLEPSFSPTVTDYKVYLPAGSEKLDIICYANDEKAMIDDFDTALSPGWNEIRVTCIAENSTSTTYVINVYVDEEPTVFYQLNGEKLGVVKNLDKISYDRFKKKETNVNNETITVFTGEYFKLLYLVNEKGEKDFYLYDKTANKVIEVFRPLVSEGKYYLPEDADYSKYSYMDDDFNREKVETAVKTVDGWGFKDEKQKDFKVIYLTDEKGEGQLYRLDTTENTIQRYVSPNKPGNKTEIPVVVYIGAGVAALALVVRALALINRKRD